ncbi:MAG: hypothetical protein IJV71_11030 [Lachnospiraceae bacterium]|nr:hypothetical protein [Lachnospiraceae bacterium]
MRSIEAWLIKEKKELERILSKAEGKCTESQYGHLKIMKKGRVLEYYCDGRYIKKSEIDIAKRIAQRDYNEKLRKKAEERVRVIEKFLKDYERTSLKELYKKTSDYRKELIYAPIISDEEYIKQWLEVPYKGKNFDEDMPEIYTDRGERVRSKSEKIIADKLHSLGIPYRYECPIMLSGNVKVYPDFTILKMPERNEVYLEHFGMMDDRDYVDKVLYKLSTYERNRIYIGVNLFFTYETSKATINTRALDELIRQLFCVE